MYIQIIYTNVLNKDSTFEYYPKGGGTDPTDLKSSTGTIVASAVVLLTLAGVGGTLATLAYKKL